jgi:hypothetical protein
MKTKKELSVPDKHRLRIARDTLRINDEKLHPDSRASTRQPAKL